MLRRVFLAVFLILGLALPALAERRVALVLAAEDYRSLRHLDNPVNDARAMEALLESLGFEVWLETDRDLRRMRRALDDFRSDAAGADVALFFFAGHGVALEGVNYLLPTDADAASSETLAATSLPLSEVQQVLNEVAPAAIVLLDACRDDPFATGGSTEGRGAVPLAGDPPDRPPPVPGLGRIGRADGVLFAFSAAPGETASDGTGENSPFTAALLRHFGTRGVELKSALTLVQQDVYDRSRGRQLPYIESGLAELVFISEKGDLPERDRLLMAMAGLTPDLRAEVEGVAAEHDMPLAPLYAAVISGDLAGQSPDERRRLLLEAAASYGQFKAELVKFAGDDPRVADLRAQAEEQLTLGAFDAARALLTEAAGIDATARAGLKENFLNRTLSEAATHRLNARAARTDLRYDLAIEDLTKAVELYAEIEADLPDRDTMLAYDYALRDLGDLYVTSGNLHGALGAYMTQTDYAEARAKENPLDLEWARELVWGLNGVGSVLQQQGFLHEAEEAYRKSYDVSASQNEATPNDADLQRDLEFALVNVGYIRQLLNDLPGALSAYQQSLGFAQLVLESEPDNVLYNRDLAQAYERVGDVMIRMGSRSDARDAYDLALKASQDLIASYPDDPELQRDLSIRYERLGDVVQLEGDLDGALAAFNEALRIREALLAQDPGNVTRKRDAAVIYERVGDIYNLLGDPGSALMSHEQARGVRADLVARDPSNMVWARDLSISLERIGDIHFAEGDPAGAAEAFAACRDLRQSIVAIDPGNFQGRRELAMAVARLGGAQAAAGDTAAALATDQEALTMRRDLHAADPTVLQSRLDIAFSQMDIGGLQQGLGDLAAAEAAYAEVVSIFDALAREEIDNQTYLYDYADYSWRLSDMILQQGDAARALAPAELGLATAQELAAAMPGETGYQRLVMLTANRVGDAQNALQNPAAARDAFQVMATAAYAVSSVDPYSTDAAWDYALALLRLGEARLALGDHAGARIELENAVALRQWLTGQSPGAVGPMRDLAYALQKLADSHDYEGSPDNGRPFEEQALALLRRIDQIEPGQVANIIDLVNGLSRTAFYAADPAPYLSEALALLERLQAEGTLPEDYVQRMEDFRTRLGQN